MKDRCYNKYSKNYHTYGGKGVSIFGEWFDFINFKKWSLENGYKEGLSLDRINVDGNYCPENCRWVTRSQNSKNITQERDRTINRHKERILYLERLLIKNNISYET